jgi:predicted 3-demethylubiquinone-9 3-methyltransferase (glyoxalase superfamily)
MAAISALYAKNEQITHCTFSPDPPSQTLTNMFLKSYGLNPEMCQWLESKWSISWLISWVVCSGLD